MSIGYVVRRLILFFITIWVATTVIFILPRLSGVNPIQERMSQSRGLAGAGGNLDKQIAYYEERFGFNDSLATQYIRYLQNTARFDFGFSIAFYPANVNNIIAAALPWTMILLSVVVVMNFCLGVFIGAIAAWPRAPGFTRQLLPPLMALSAIPYYLIAVMLLFFLAFKLGIFPLGGGYDVGTQIEMSPGFIIDAIHHSILPAISIIVSSLGLLALGMRGMMITTLGEDYMLLAEARGLKGWRLFTWYGLRNAMLPQFTILGLQLGVVISGAILVEVVFSYPGLGGTLLSAIRFFDYTLLSGLVYMTILMVAGAMLIVDLLYPRLDPRIRLSSRCSVPRLVLGWLDASLLR